MEIDYKKIEEIIQRYGTEPEDLLMILQDISEIYNYVPPVLVPFLSQKLNIGESLIYGVATFYKTVSLEPKGKYMVSVCTGTACHVRGAEKLMDALENDLGIEEGGTTEDLEFSLEGVRCIGCCASGPVITVNKDTHGGLDRSTVLESIAQYKKSG